MLPFLSYDIRPSSTYTRLQLQLFFRPFHPGHWTLVTSITSITGHWSLLASSLALFALFLLPFNRSIDVQADSSSYSGNGHSCDFWVTDKYSRHLFNTQVARCRMQVSFQCFLLHSHVQSAVHRVCMVLSLCICDTEHCPSYDFLKSFTGLIFTRR